MLELPVLVQALIGAAIGTTVADFSGVWIRRRLAQRRAAAELARREDLQRRAIAMRDEKRAAGEHGLVIIDHQANEVRWMPTAIEPVIGPEGRA